MIEKQHPNKPKAPGFFKGYGNPGLFFLRLGAILITAGLQPLLSAPFSWWPLHWVAWVPFLWAIHSQKGRGNTPLAYIGGTIANLLIFYWMINLLPNFTNIPLSLSVFLVFLLCSYLSLMWIVMSRLIPKIRHYFPRLWVFISPALLVAMEFLMPQLFPCIQGATHYQVIPIIQLSSITGVYGVSYLIFWANCVLFEIISGYYKKRIFRWKHGLALLITISLVIGYGLVRIQKYKTRIPESKILSVGLIQANFSPADAETMGFEKMHQIYLNLSHQAVRQGARWIIWSEGEFPIPLNTAYAKKILTKASQEMGCPILLGGYGNRRINNKYVPTNSAIHVDPHKGMGKQYDKQFLVPFGEYMPFEKHLSFIYSKINWKSRFHPGDDSVVQKIQNIPYAFLICYEAIFPSLSRQAVNRGARLLVNITFDAWFGRTTAPYQHLMLATIRSAEMGIPLIRLATTGISTTVNALGEMGDLSSLFKQEVLLYEVPLVYLPTIYSRIGDIFAWICFFTTVFSLILIVFKHQKSPSV